MQISENIILKSGIISKNEEWFGNIVIKNNLIIPKGVSVSVLPGTRIKFISEENEIEPLIEKKISVICDNFSVDFDKYICRSSIVIYGNLYIHGSKSNRVCVGNYNWNGFIFVASSGKIKFKYTDIRYGFGIILDNDARLSKINSCLIEQCYIGIISFSGLIVKHSDIRYNNIGVILFKKSVLVSNNINDNLLYGIYIFSKKIYIFKNNISLNYTGVFIFSSFHIKLKSNNINNNVIAIVLRNSVDVVLDNIINHNEYSISVEDDSNDIVISGVLFKSKNGVDVNNFSNVKIEDVGIVFVDRGISTNNCSQTEVISSNFIKNNFNLVATNNSNINIFDSNCNSECVNLLLLDETSIYLNNTLLNANDQNIANIGNCSKIYINKSKMVAKNIACTIELYSEFYFNNSSSYGNRFIRLSNNSILYLNNINLEIMNNIIDTKGDNSIHVSNCDIKSEKGMFVLLNNKSDLKVENSRIYSKLQFCTAQDFSCGRVLNSDICSDSTLVELQDDSYISIYDTKLFSQDDFLLKIKNKSKVKIIQCDIIIAKYFVQQNDFGYIECSSTNIKGGFFLSMEHNSMFYLKNNIISSKKINISSYSLSQLFIIQNKIQTDVCKINLDGKNECLLQDNEIEVKKTFTMDINNSSIFFYRDIINAEFYSISSMFSNISMYMFKIISNFDFYLRFSFINLNKSFFYSNTQKKFILENSSCKLIDTISNNLQIRSIGNNIIQSESNELKIVDSNIEGNIIGECLSEIKVEGSKIGDIEVESNSKVEIEGSEIEGERIWIKGEGEIGVKDSDIKVCGEIEIEGAGKVKIEGSEVYTKKGLVKRGYDNLIVNNTDLKAESCCLDMSGNFDIYCENIKLQSKYDFAVRANNINITFENIEIISNRGFLCNSINCSIVNLNATIFVNFLDINNTKFSIIDSSIIYKIPKEFISLSNDSILTLDNTKLTFSNDRIFLQYLDCSLIDLKQNSILKLHKFVSNIKYSNNLLFLNSDSNSCFSISKIFIDNLDNFVSMKKLSFGIIEDSIVDVRSSIANIFQEASLISLYNKFTNMLDYKFNIKDVGILYLYKTTILRNQLLIMTNLSQVVMCNNHLKLSGQICRIKECSLLKDYKSKWFIDKSYDKEYAFCLQNISKFILVSSKIEAKEQLFFITDYGKLNVQNTNIIADNRSILIFVKDKAIVTIFKSIINAFSLGRIKDYANIIIGSSFIYAKSSVLKLLGNSKTIVDKSCFENKFYHNKGTAFEKYNNSVLKINNSNIKNFNVGIKYDDNKNIDINNSDIECSNELNFTNTKRYISIKNPATRRLLYKMQQFVVTTNNIMALNIIYKLIYFLSIYVYTFYINKQNLLALYLRRGMLNNWIAGSSDIDYLIVLKDLDSTYEYNYIYEIKKNYRKIRKIFPFYGENLIMNKKELDFYIKYGGIRSGNLQNSKLLYGKENVIKRRTGKDDLLNKIDICSEILNSYMLLNNNYFYNIDIISDLCFAKAATDIIKNIEYFYTGDKPLSRIDFLSKQNNVNNNEIFKILYDVLKDVNRINKEQRNLIFEYVFESLDRLSKNFNYYMISNSVLQKNKIKEYEDISVYKELNSFKDDIKMIVLDSPGWCHLVLNKSIDTNKMLLIYEKTKEKYDVYSTPVMFFTKDMFQMLIMSNFKNNPLDYYKIDNIKEEYKNREVYLNGSFEYFFHGDKIIKQLILTAVSELAIHINDMDITCDFNDIKYGLFSVLLQILQFSLCLKNGKIMNRYSDIVKEYNNNEYFKDIISIFNSNLKLSSDEKIFKVITFIKKLKDEIINEYK